MTVRLNSLASCRVQYAVRTALCMLAVGSAGVQPALAADDDSLSEVTVTAQRREQNQRDVPISLTVFSADSVNKQNFQGVENYFAETPNVSFTTQGSRDRKVLALRGVSDLLSPDSNIREGSFAFYVDEFDVAPGTVNPELVDVDHIEVLRGPQGTYFGRNSVGGAINIVTKQPTNDWFLEGSSQYSSFNTVDSHVIVNAPLINDVLALRVVGRYERSDGNIKNINPIGGGNDNKYDYGKAQLRFTPNEALTVDLIGAITKEDTGMRDGVPSGVLASFSQFLYGQPPYNGQAIPDGVGFWPNNTDKVNFNRPQDVGTRYAYGENRIRYSAEDFSVTNVIGYINSNEFLMGDIDGSSIDFFYEQESIKRDALSEELRIQSNPGKMIDWTAGLFFSHDRGHTRQFTYAGAQAPAFLELSEGAQVTSSYSDADAKSYAGFAEAVWHATPALAATVGGRYTHEQVSQLAYNTSSGVINNLVNAGATFNNFSPRFSVNYALNDSQNVYATISRGFKSGGVQPGTPLTTQSYAPETLWNYEVGFKGEFLDRRLQVNSSIFYMDWKNLQTESAFGQTNESGAIEFTGVIANAASAKSYGVESEVIGRVLPDLTLSGGIGYDQAKFGDYKNAYVEGALVDLSGAQLPNAPRWTGHAAGEYSYHFDSQHDGFVRLEWNFKGAIKPDLTSEVHTGFPYDVPSYNVANLRLGVTTANWDVIAFAQNLFDRKYYTNAYEKAFAGGMFLNPSYRSFGVKVTVRTQ
ncbi:MAG TPA: TonB-dependent receptor [Steroidobacteraceae bacterium]|nr:TonB-dependent receptor [Steroidobacteraceae bacterium]